MTSITTSLFELLVKGLLLFLFKIDSAILAILIDFPEVVGI